MGSDLEVARSKREPWSYVAEGPALRAMARELGGLRRIAVDTESDSMYSYFEKVCLVQISGPDRAWIVDPLALEGDLSPLAPVFADPSILKVLHGADYDVVCLKRDFGFELQGIFDTMVAAQFLGLEKIGLADLVEDSFGRHLDKKHARTNWGRRPLSAAELEYSYLDVKYLIQLSSEMEEKLAAADLREETELEFRRLEARQPAQKEFDPDGYTRIRGTRDLGEVELSILRELFVMRDRRARKIDRPPFKVVANDTLLRISRGKPRRRADLEGVKGVTRLVSRNLGSQILGAVSRGIERRRPPAPRKRKPRGPRLSPRRQRLVDLLKTWRKECAEGRELPNLAVLPNHAILEVALEGPTDIEALGALPTVGEKRARLYGEEILDIVKSCRRR